jgi:hypothetical protein
MTLYNSITVKYCTAECLNLNRYGVCNNAVSYRPYKPNSFDKEPFLKGKAQYI